MFARRKGAGIENNAKCAVWSDICGTLESSIDIQARDVAATHKVLPTHRHVATIRRGDLMGGDANGGGSSGRNRRNGCELHGSERPRQKGTAYENRENTCLDKGK